MPVDPATIHAIAQILTYSEEMVPGYLAESRADRTALSARYALRFGLLACRQYALLPPAICHIANTRAVPFYILFLFHKPPNLTRVFIGLFVIIDGNEQ